MTTPDTGVYTDQLEPYNSDKKQANRKNGNRQHRKKVHRHNSSSGQKSTTRSSKGEKEYTHKSARRASLAVTWDKTLLTVDDSVDLKDSLSPNRNCWIVNTIEQEPLGTPTRTIKTRRSHSDGNHLIVQDLYQKSCSPQNSITSLGENGELSEMMDAGEIEKSLIPFAKMAKPPKDLALKLHQPRPKRVGHPKSGSNSIPIKSVSRSSSYRRDENSNSEPLSFTSPDGQRHMIVPTESGRCYALKSYDKAPLKDAAALVIDMDKAVGETSDGSGQLLSRQSIQSVSKVLSSMGGDSQARLGLEMEKTRRFRTAALILSVCSQLTTCLICFSVPAFLLAFRRPRNPTDRRHYQISLLFSLLSIILFALVVCVTLYLYLNTGTRKDTRHLP